ncbi:response regulator [Ectothiorhodospiraceae bacterium BW-2]|nr:response regulator [Ectothiorhodospiraceae bacterium BW-2]
MSDYKILIVDDEPLNLSIMEELLHDRYHISCCESGYACLEQTATFEPDLILMDVNMPGITGLETCQRLKQTLETANTPVIFVSALTLPEEKMAGYQAGGEDYIPKPFDEEELITKIELALNNKKRLDEFQKSSSEAMHTAMIAMTNAGEIGTVLQFFRDSFTIHNYQALAERLVAAIREYGLSCAVQISLPEKRRYRATSSGAIKPLMFQALELLQDGERIFDFDYRTAFNFHHVSFLILNMPTHDMEYYGRLKDHLALLGEGVQAAVESLLVQEHEQQLGQQRQQTSASLSETLTLFEQRQRESQYATTNIMHTVQNEVEYMYNHLELTEAQERYLTAVIDRASQELEQLHDAQTKLGDHLQTIIQRLDTQP